MLVTPEYLQQIIQVLTIFGNANMEHNPSFFLRHLNNFAIRRTVCLMESYAQYQKEKMEAECG